MNLKELHAWANSSEGEDRGRSLFNIVYDDGRRAPIAVEEEKPGAWKFWAGRKWSSPHFKTRNDAARALVLLLSEYERLRDAQRTSGVQFTFDAREELKKRGLG